VIVIPEVEVTVIEVAIVAAVVARVYYRYRTYSLGL